MLKQRQLMLSTRGRGFHEISRDLRQLVAESGIETGLCRIFIHHTSASLIIMENADPAVLDDLEAWMARLVKDGDALFTHTAEGPDDMSAHVRTALTHSDLSIPVRDGELDLGTWQGVFVWEHRTAGHRRRVTVSVDGD